MVFACLQENFPLTALGYTPGFHPTSEGAQEFTAGTATLRQWVKEGKPRAAQPSSADPKQAFPAANPAHQGKALRAY